MIVATCGNALGQLLLPMHVPSLLALKGRERTPETFFLQGVVRIHHESQSTFTEVQYVASFRKFFLVLGAPPLVLLL